MPVQFYAEVRQLKDLLTCSGSDGKGYRYCHDTIRVSPDFDRVTIEGMNGHILGRVTLPVSEIHGEKVEPMLFGTKRIIEILKGWKPKQMLLVTLDQEGATFCQKGSAEHRFVPKLEYNRFPDTTSVLNRTAKKSVRFRLDVDLLYQLATMVSSNRYNEQDDDGDMPGHIIDIDVPIDGSMIPLLVSSQRGESCGAIMPISSFCDKGKGKAYTFITGGTKAQEKSSVA